MNDKAGCLIIHGFGGNIQEVQPLTAALTGQGYRVMVPQLAGHTGRKADLKNVSYSQWLHSAEDGLHALRSECDTIYLIGFSMGGLIAINLGLNYPAAGIVTLNTPIYYWNMKQVGMNIVADLRENDFKNLRRYFQSATDLPLSALVNFRMLLSETKGRLPELSCPILIAQSMDDDTVQKRSADYLFDHVGSRHKDLKFYNSSDHLILWSQVGSMVIRDTLKFLNNPKGIAMCL